MDKDQKPIINLPPKELPIVPVTLQQIEDEMNKRVSVIDREFREGFEFIKNKTKSVTFFGSARFKEDNEHYKRAQSIAGKLSKLGYSIITGGGPGIMEAANRGAYEAGGTSLGLTIELTDQQVRNPYLTDTADFYYFFTRKMMMSFSAEAYLFFPGGFGTLDETFEILTLVQTHKIENVPIFLIGESFWKPVEEFMKKYMLEQNQAIDKQDLSLYTITDDEEKVIAAIQTTPVRNGVRLPKDLPLK